MATGEIDVTPGRVLGPEELVTYQKLNDLATPTLRVKPLAITARELADGAINADKLSVDLEAQLGLADNSVTTNKIVDGAVITSKLQTQIQLRDASVVPAGSLPIYRPAGLIYANVDALSNPGPAFDNWLHKFVVPANLMSRDGDTLVMINTFQTMANDESKQLVIHFAGVDLFGNFIGALNNTAVTATTRIVRKAVTEQRAIVTWNTSPAGGGAFSHPVQTIFQDLSVSFPMGAVANAAFAGRVSATFTTIAFYPAPV